MKKTLFSVFCGLLISLLTGCAPFSAIGTAEVDKGFSLQIQSGVTVPPSQETYWFYDYLSDCPLCDANSIFLAQIGSRYGFKPLSLGLFVSGDGIQAEIYRQLHDGGKVDYGIGGRIGLPLLIEWYSHQIFFRYDLRLKKKLKLLLNPTLYYHTGESPNGANQGSLLFLTPSIGLALESKHVTLFPNVSLIMGKGNLNRRSEPERKFNDIFFSFSLGLSFHKAKN
ncbi:MAG: hypothetical protein D6732_07685 [Methanobacteriota archaeon]|nr:MAG: hypothetical protein D6732_07685 [Euryarchaeota archaeon]